MPPSAEAPPNDSFDRSRPFGRADGRADTARFTTPQLSRFPCLTDRFAKKQLAVPPHLPIEADRIIKTGLATAETIQKQAAASGGAQYQLTRQVIERLAKALEKSGVDIVPRVQINGGSGAAGEGGGSLQALIGMLLSEKGMAMLNSPAAANGKAGLPDKSAIAVK